MGPPQKRDCPGELRVQLDGFCEQLPSPDIRLLLEPAEQFVCLKVEIKGLIVLSGMSPRACHFTPANLHCHFGDYLAGDLILQGKDVLQLPVVGFRPKLVSRDGVDELGVNADPVSGLLDTALHHVAYPQLPANLLHFHLLALVGGRCRSVNNEDIRNLVKLGGDVFGYPVDKISLFGVSAHVDKRQHDNGGLIWQLKRRNLLRGNLCRGRNWAQVKVPDRHRNGQNKHRNRSRPNCLASHWPGFFLFPSSNYCHPRFHHYTVGSHRLGNILDLLLAQKFITQRELGLDVIKGRLGDADASRVC